MAQEVEFLQTLQNPQIQRGAANSAPGKCQANQVVRPQLAAYALAPPILLLNVSTVLILGKRYGFAAVFGRQSRIAKVADSPLAFDLVDSSSKTPRHRHVV